MLDLIVTLKEPVQTLIRTHPLRGKQLLVRFPNGFGASVVQFGQNELTVGGIPLFRGSYGAEDGLYEMAVISFNSSDISDFRLRYDTPITDAVLGYLKPEDVKRYLSEISLLGEENA